MFLSPNTLFPRGPNTLPLIITMSGNVLLLDLLKWSTYKISSRSPISSPNHFHLRSKLGVDSIASPSLKRRNSENSQGPHTAAQVKPNKKTSSLIRPNNKSNWNASVQVLQLSFSNCEQDKSGVSREETTRGIFLKQKQKQGPAGPSQHVLMSNCFTALESEDN